MAWDNVPPNWRLSTSNKQRACIEHATGLPLFIIRACPLKGGKTGSANGAEEGSPYDAWEMCKQFQYDNTDGGGWIKENYEWPRPEEKIALAKLISVVIPELKVVLNQNLRQHLC